MNVVFVHATILKFDFKLDSKNLLFTQLAVSMGILGLVCTSTLNQMHSGTLSSKKRNQIVCKCIKHSYCYKTLIVCNLPISSNAFISGYIPSEFGNIPNLVISCQLGQTSGVKTETTSQQSSVTDLTFQIKITMDEAAKGKTDPISTLDLTIRVIPLKPT